jgi:hypothetical protein
MEKDVNRDKGDISAATLNLDVVFNRGRVSLLYSKCSRIFRSLEPVER